MDDKAQQKAQKAQELFKEGYNCAQSVFGAFAQDLNMDFETAMKLASSFGGGMGRLREVCGAVSAMFMIAGLKKGYYNCNDYEKKAAHYEFIQNLAKEFKKDNGSIICRELLGLESEESSNLPSKRTPEYYANRPCERLIGYAAKLIEKNI